MRLALNCRVEFRLPGRFPKARKRSPAAIVPRQEVETAATALAVMQASGPESWHPRPEFPFDTGGGPLFDIGSYYPTALALGCGPVSLLAAGGAVMVIATVVL